MRVALLLLPVVLTQKDLSIAPVGSSSLLLTCRMAMTHVVA